MTTVKYTVLALLSHSRLFLGLNLGKVKLKILVTLEKMPGLMLPMSAQVLQKISLISRSSIPGQKRLKKLKQSGLLNSLTEFDPFLIINISNFSYL